MQTPRRSDITWFIEAICAATAVAGVAQICPQPAFARAQCRVVDPRTLSERAQRSAPLALPRPRD